MDREAFEAALREWAQGELGDRAEAVVIDGERLRGIEEVAVAVQCGRHGDRWEEPTLWASATLTDA